VSDESCSDELEFSDPNKREAISMDITCSCGAEYHYRGDPFWAGKGGHVFIRTHKKCSKWVSNDVPAFSESPTWTIGTPEGDKA